MKLKLPFFTVIFEVLGESYERAKLTDEAKLRVNTII